MFKSIVRVAFANIVNFGSSFIVGFILPAILSVSAYGYYKEYTLFLSFVYLFNLGFNDGIYIKYGGADPKNVDHEILHEEHNFVRIFQILTAIPVLIFGLATNNIIIVMFAITGFFITIKTYHQNYAQAVGNFKLFSNGNVLRSFIYILFLLLGVFILRSDNYLFYIVINIISYAVAFLYYEYKFHKSYGFQNNWSFDGKFNLFKIGFFILIANMSLTFVANVGSWVVNFGFSIEEFAQYSFQNSVLNVLLLIINAVGMVFYNVISKKEDATMLRLTKRICLFLGIFGGLGFFVFKFIIETFLSDYTAALPLLSVTFIAIPYIMVSKIITANLYKSRKNEKRYFRDAGGFALFSLIFVGLVYIFTNSMLLIAFATTVSYVLWFLYSTRIEYKYLKSSTKELLLLASHFIIFFICATNFGIILGFTIYLLYVGLVAIAFNNELKELVKFARK